MLLESLLDKDDYEIHTYLSAEEAIEAMKDLHSKNGKDNYFNIAIVDFNMPIMDGLQVSDYH